MAKEDYILKQTGEQVQKAIDDALALAPATVETPGLMSAADKEKLNGLPTGASLESSLGGKVDKVTGKGLSTNDYDNSEKSKVASASQDVTDIKAKIPSQASDQNQLADKDFVNSSIATATADFKGTYDSLSELQAVTADKNDYGYVVSTDQSGNTVYSRYKYNGSAWVFEYDLNNSSFTAAEWASIQSQITSALVQKLSALPTNQELSQSLSGKQDTISDLSTIRSGAAAGATAYQKPASGIPASDMASGVIPEDVVKYASQTLTDSQKTQARTNIGAASKDELDAISRGEYVEAWDGVSEPVVADIPSGVQVEYNSQTYTGTLAASNDTLGKIYLVATGTSNEYNRYRTSRSGVEGSYTYSWVPFGSTQIDLANYATTSEVSQLQHKVTNLENEIYAVNLIDSSFFTGTFYWFENGVVKTISNSTSRYVSGLIPVFEKESIKFKSRVGTTYLSLVAFDSTKTPIESKSVVGTNAWLEDTYIVPSGVSYIQVQNYSISSYPGCYVQTKGMANDISERAVEYDELTLVRFINLASSEDILNDTTVNYQGNVVSSSGRHCLKIDISSYPVGQFFTIYGFNLGSGTGYYALYNGGTKISFASFTATSGLVTPLFVEKPNGATHLYVSIDGASSSEGGYDGLVACLGKGLVGQVPMMKYVKTISDYELDALNKTEIMSEIGKNIANKDNIDTIGVNSNGVVLSGDQYQSVRINVSEYVAGTKVTFGGFFLGQSGTYSFTDASNSTITYGVFADPNGIANPVTVEVPQGAVLLTFPVLSPNSPSNPYEELMANVGEELLPYEGYQQIIKKIGKYTFAGGAEDSRVPALVAEIGEMQDEIADLQDLGGIIVDLPVSDGLDISVGYAYINSSTGAVIVKQ